MGGREDYAYLPLEDAMKAVGQKVNLFAAVYEIGVPWRSRGTEQPSKLPHVKSCGDIICLHRVTIGLHNGDVYCAFHKRFSSFALFEGKTGQSVIAYESSANYHGMPQDDEFIRRLRIWVVKQDSGVDAYTVELRGIKVGQSFDLICKVLYVCESSEGEWMLFVWDGTDAPPISFQRNLDVEGQQLPLHLEASPLPREVLLTFPTVGTVLRVTTKHFFKEIAQLEQGGAWVRVRNIICEMHSGMWKGVLQTSSKIRFLSDEDDHVLDRVRFYKERISSEKDLSHLRRPLSSFPQPSRLTVTDYVDVLDATLMDSLTHAEVTHKLKCIVRVVAAYPWRIENLRSPANGHYRVRLTLEDPTARIHAYLCEEDGVKFFCGYPPAAELAIKWNRLLGISDNDRITEDNSARRDPPWVWCCLKSFYADKNDPWGSRMYRVYATKLLG